MLLQVGKGYNLFTIQRWPLSTGSCQHCRLYLPFSSFRINGVYRPFNLPARENIKNGDVPCRPAAFLLYFALYKKRKRTEGANRMNERRDKSQL